jgi:hypothetical protein
VPRDVTTRFRIEGLDDAERKARSLARSMGEVGQASAAAGQSFAGAATPYGLAPGPIGPGPGQLLYGGQPQPGPGLLPGGWGGGQPFPGYTVPGGPIIPPGGVGGSPPPPPGGVSGGGGGGGGGGIHNNLLLRAALPFGTHRYASMLGGFATAGFGYSALGYMASTGAENAQFAARYPEANQGGEYARNTVENIPLLGMLIKGLTTPLRELADATTVAARRMREFSIEDVRASGQLMLAQRQTRAEGFTEIAGLRAERGGNRIAAEESARTMARMGAPGVLESLRPRPMPFEPNTDIGQARAGVIQAEEQSRVAQREYAEAQGRFNEFSRQPFQDIASLRKELYGGGPAGDRGLQGSLEAAQLKAQQANARLSQDPRRGVLGQEPTEYSKYLASRGIGTRENIAYHDVRTEAVTAGQNVQDLQQTMKDRQVALIDAEKRAQTELTALKEKAKDATQAEYNLQVAQLGVMERQTQAAGNRAAAARASAQYAGGAAPGTLEQTLAAVQQYKQFGMEGLGEEQKGMIRAHPGAGPQFAYEEEQYGKTGYRGRLNQQINQLMGLGDFTRVGGRNVGGNVQDIEAEFNRMQDDLAAKRQENAGKFRQKISDEADTFIEQIIALIRERMSKKLEAERTEAASNKIGREEQKHTAPP